jgi:hypothetical protein
MRFSWKSYADAAQDHLRSKLHDLTASALSWPVVAVGWNSERFDGRNLALRRAAATPRSIGTAAVGKRWK